MRRIRTDKLRYCRVLIGWIGCEDMRKKLGVSPTLVLALLAFATMLLMLTALPAVAQQSSFEPQVNRPGFDYRNFDMRLDASPNMCRDACSREPACKAWTFVHAGRQGSSPRCWLKSRVPAKRDNDCCVSGLIY